MSTNKKNFSLLMENTPGVLSRIAGLFTRRGFNIDSITAGVTDDPHLTRMTIATHGDDEVINQIVKQLAKLEEVIQIRELKDECSVIRELILVRVAVNEQERAQVISMAEVFRAKVVDIAEDNVIFELTGDHQKIEAFLKLLGSSRIQKVARTGAAGLPRGMFNSDETEIYNR